MNILNIKNMSANFEVHFWETLENSILEKISGLTPILNSPERFSYVTIIDDSPFKEYGLVFNKLKVLLQQEKRDTYLIIKKNNELSLNISGIQVYDEKITIRSFKFNNNKEAETMAEFIAEQI
jgi:hypothetical protein